MRNENEALGIRFWGVEVGKIEEASLQIWFVGTFLDTKKVIWPEL